MNITIIDHGRWESYTPDPMPAWVTEAGPGYRIGFARRVEDGVDWYEFLKAGDAFQPNPLVCTVLLNPYDGIETVKAVTRDPTTLFPAKQRLIEITGHDVEDTKPHNEFAWMTYDPATKTLSDPVPEPIISVRDYQFAGQASAEGIISDDAAMAWVATGKTPDTLIEAVKAKVTDPDRQKRVLLFLAGTTIFPRMHELTPLLAASFGKDTPEKVDAFFRAASQR